jgi:hypothetical protein
MSKVDGVVILYPTQLGEVRRLKGDSELIGNAGADNDNALVFVHPATPMPVRVFKELKHVCLFGVVLKRNEQRCLGLIASEVDEPEPATPLHSTVREVREVD